ncbi:unnamed protein product [Vitrella brassicaformis CCMP3155]|uniref:BTB domain-containing protein n=2 Tax=Vitrella brassicaformis TaxID=1169539 RepID=A0A0G4EJT3_VITBC|nr:unnamed protein product [Vitrella brassicaformis CCMP3155]|mmetsp:Transcript_6654/g.19315  ORF Transcript_6654/g.19315 Transcript_6654/m.19315 type:complete len:452 (+) Transcript_6654:28-1383(+)|eukprot:CEL96653.1 unnamed protein product [Vitrella brassicaformis CCMP3155]
MDEGTRPEKKRRLRVDCITVTNELQISYVWEIKNFSLLRARATAEQVGEDDRLFSPTFPTEPAGGDGSSDGDGNEISTTPPAAAAAAAAAGAAGSGSTTELVPSRGHMAGNGGEDGNESMGGADATIAAREDVGKWSICVWPSGEGGSENQGCVSVFAHLMTHSDVVAKCAFVCLDPQHNEISETRMQTRLRKFSHNEGKESNRGFSQFLTADQWNEYILEDTFRLKCEIAVIPDCEHEPTAEPPAPKANPETISQDLRWLVPRESESSMASYSDITLVTEGHQFRAHKCILAARSTVFAAMFGGRFEESSMGTVHLWDTPETIQSLLKYIYTESCDEVTQQPLPFDSVLALFQAADKYALQGLKLKCASVLERNMRPDSVVRVLIEADRHNEPRLKESAARFICGKYGEVSGTEDWRRLDRHPSILKHLLECFAQPSTLLVGGSVETRDG